MIGHRTGTREEWLVARAELLDREKEQTRLGDELARSRRELPWVPVETEYRLDTDDGEKALVELFDGRSQLLVYHFMFGPSYEAGCPVNSSIRRAQRQVVGHRRRRLPDGGPGLQHVRPRGRAPSTTPTRRRPADWSS
jgi:predicted dithiol-disulfide oxidoreductase (DUF899 family)